MPNENSQPESTEKKKREVEVRDLKPKTDPNGSASEIRLTPRLSLRGRTLTIGPWSNAVGFQ
jgi:hypothetical protein